MTTAARTIECSETQSLREENKRLEQDLASLRVRTKTMYRALTEKSGRTVAVVGVFGRGETVDKVVQMARMAEALDEVPQVRFIRDRGGRINGVELALMERTPSLDEGHDPGFRSLAQLALGMAVVGDEA